MKKNFEELTYQDRDRYRLENRDRANFDMIRQIHDQIVMMGRAHGLTIVENTEPIQQMVDMAIERIKGANSDQFLEVHDPIRDEMNELLAMQRQHLPVKVQFDVKRVAMNLGIEEDTITTLFVLDFKKYLPAVISGFDNLYAMCNLFRNYLPLVEPLKECKRMFEKS